MRVLPFRPRSVGPSRPLPALLVRQHAADEGHRARKSPLTLPSQKSANPPASPGGNTDSGESPRECAVRECREETGMAFEGEPRLLGSHFIRHRGAAWPANHIGFVFDGGALTDERIASFVLDPAEHTEVQVHTLEEWRAGTVAYLER
ncbi:NUDIX domain-containing protein [Streptomyces goshikiensis]|uniref:NUDIX domain-containing protein n=1 Tax=Streptomyces goshikiensis TaxID=1942 RepID=UPI003710B695